MLGIPPSRIKVIACATVIEEMQPLMPPDMQRQVLEFGLHLHPGSLTHSLQTAIDQSTQADLILLGYGLCSRAVVGLRATHCPLAVPRVDDCIAIFLGSRAAYCAQARQEAGTYYLTKGWIEVGDSPFEEYKRLQERYGEQKAMRMIKLMLKNYKRLAFINTGTYELSRYREYARQTAAQFGLRFEEIEGAPTLIEKLLFGPWDDEIVVCQPGQTLTYDLFAPTPVKAALA